MSIADIKARIDELNEKDKADEQHDFMMKSAERSVKISSTLNRIFGEGAK